MPICSANNRGSKSFARLLRVIEKTCKVLEVYIVKNISICYNIKEWGAKDGEI